MWGVTCRRDREISVERVDEHAKSIERQDSKSALSQHQEQSGHRWNNNPIIDKIKVLDKELRDLDRKILAVHIKLRGSTLNCNDRYMTELYLLLLLIFLLYDLKHIILILFIYAIFPAVFR